MDTIHISNLMIWEVSLCDDLMAKFATATCVLRRQPLRSPWEKRWDDDAAVEIEVKVVYVFHFGKAEKQMLSQVG